jgi:hypothetical protein
MNATIAPFVWKDFSRFVELRPVRTGWLVVWGRYEEAGRRKVLAGTQTYPALDGARRRVADAVLELTKRPDLAREALVLLDRHRFPPHQPAPHPDPL